MLSRLTSAHSTYLLLLVTMTSMSQGCDATPPSPTTQADKPQEPVAAVKPDDASAKGPEGKQEDEEYETGGELDAEPPKPRPPEPPRFKVKHGDAPTKECTARLDAAYIAQLSVAGTGGGLADGSQREVGAWNELAQTLEEEAERVGLERGIESKTVDLEIPVSVLDADGIRSATATANFQYGDLSVWIPGPLQNFALASRTCVLPKGAWVKHRRLSGVTEGAEKAAKWASKQEGKPYKAVGEVKGTFGAGVDRVVVVALKNPVDSMELEEGDTKKEAELACQAEFAIAMKGDVVHGDLAVGRPIGRAAQRKCAKDLTLFMSELGLAGVADLDGDGTEELLWTFGYFISPATQALVMTGLSGGKFGRWTLAEHTYAGSEVFIDPKECGRSKTKWASMKPDAPPCYMRD